MLTALLVAGRLVGVAFACGLNLYVTLAIVGLASRFGWIERLPPALVGLEQWLLIGAALALFLVEFVAASIPLVDSFWEAVHTVIRPLAALCLALVGLEGVPWAIRVPAALAAAAIALAAHATKVGLRFVILTRRHARLAVTVVADLGAAGFALLALAQPNIALPVVLAILALHALLAPAIWRAAVFGGRAVRARIRGFFRGTDWRAPGEVPSPLRRLLDPQIEGLPPARTAPAALSMPRLGRWRNGWLVFDRGQASFVYRHRFRPRRIELRRPAETSIENGLLTDRITLETREGACTLHLLKDGPPAEIAVGALQLVIE